MSSYVPTDWVDGVTPVNATNLEKLEQAVADAYPRLVPTPLVEGRWLKVQGGAMAWMDAAAEYQALSAKGAANGYASLGADGKVPAAQLPPLGGAPGYGIALPASPSDGQEYILVDSLTAPTYAWRFIYVAGIADANKWVLVGGSWLGSETYVNSTTLSSGSYVALAGLPDLAIPRAGVYDLEYGFKHNAWTGAFTRMVPVLGATLAANDDYAAIGSTIPSPGGDSSGHRALRIALVAGTLTTQYRITGGQHQLAWRYLRARPVRVA